MKRTMTFALAAVAIVSMCLFSATVKDALGGIMSIYGDTFKKATFDQCKSATIAETTASRTVTLADYGRTIFVSYAGAVAITLPANGASAGTWFEVVITTENAGTVTCSAATVDTLIAFNDAAADAVTFATGHRIGACVRFISNGSYWVAHNMSANNTMGIST